MGSDFVGKVVDKMFEQYTLRFNQGERSFEGHIFKVTREQEPQFALEGGSMVYS